MMTSIPSSGVVFPLPLHDPDSVGADDWADERVHLEEVNAKPEEIAADGGQDQGRLNNTPIRTLRWGGGGGEGRGVGRGDEGVAGKEGEEEWRGKRGRSGGETEGR